MIEIAVFDHQVGSLKSGDSSGSACGRAIRSVARADADVKGQASDPAYALEKMVLDVVRARPRSQ